MESCGNFLSKVAILVTAVTVCALPWMLGGVVPLARAVLLCGALVAGTLSICSHLCRRRLPNSVPIIVGPLIGIALLGVWQLRSGVDPVAAIEHSASPQSNLPSQLEGTVSSLSPADTRFAISLMIATSIIAFVCFDQIRGIPTITVVGCTMIANAVVLVGVGVSHALKDMEFALNKLWSLGGPHPFASFVNANSAAGWLCLGFALSVGWLAFQLRGAAIDSRRQMGTADTPVLERLWQKSMMKLANMTVWNVLPMASLAMLAVGVATTSSRGGMVAIAAGTAAVLIMRSSWRRLPNAVLVILICTVSIGGIMNWLELDQSVVAELETLQDIETAAGPRLQHWQSSLDVVRDFPITGTGLGSYRFATLPYQQFHSGVWFRHADNQYLEMLVEGGVIGVMLFIVIFVVGAIIGRIACKRADRKHVAGSRQAVKVSRRLYAAVGTAVLLATISQAVAAFLDYGVGMPPAVVLLIAIISVATGVLCDGVESKSVRDTCAVRCWPVLVTALQIGLIGVGMFFVRDQIAAASVDKSVVTATHLLARPITAAKLDQLAQERATLQLRITDRPDDPEGLRMLSRLCLAEFRWHVLLDGFGSSVREDAALARYFERFSVYELASRTARLTFDDPDAAKTTTAVFTRGLEELQVPKILKALQQRYPLMPNIAIARAEVAILTNDMATFEEQFAIAQFTEPSNAQTHFQLGALAIRRGKTDLAQASWQRACGLSAEFQTRVLADALDYGEFLDAMNVFGPDTFRESVIAAQACHNQSLRKSSWQQAEDLWPDASANRTEELDLMRGQQLEALGERGQANSLVAGLRTGTGQPYPTPEVPGENPREFR